MVDRLSTLLAQQGGDFIWAMDIMQDPNLVELWRMLPRGMIFLMQYVLEPKVLMVHHTSISFEENQLLEDTDGAVDWIPDWESHRND